MAELDTNFVDAVLSANMNGKKRVRLTQIAENEYIVEDITEYEKVGSEYGQKEINTLNETVNGKVNKVEVIDDLDTVKAVTEDNVPVGCKAVTKFANDVNQSLTELSGAEYVANSEQSNIATFDTSSWDDGAYLIFNYYVGAGSFFELLIKRGSNIAITNLTRKSTVNGTVVTMEVGNFWCLLFRKCIYR